MFGAAGLATFIVGDLGGERAVRAAGVALIVTALVVAIIHVSTWR